MMDSILFAIFVGTISAAFSYMLDFALGYPGKDDASEVNVRAALFGWSLWLAKRYTDQAMQNKIWGENFVNQLQPEKPYTKLDSVIVDRQRKLQIFGIGRELFTWEYAAGMCIFCTNFWLSLIFATIFYFTSFPDWIIFITTPAFAHLILRKL